MKLSQLNIPSLRDVYKITDLEHFFDITTDRRGNYVYNLNETVYFDIPDENLQKTKTTHPMQWSLISYMIYDTTRLAWLLMKINGIGPDDVFETVPAGTVVKYIPTSTVQSIIGDIV